MRLEQVPFIDLPSLEKQFPKEVFATVALENRCPVFVEETMW
jgi:hypothetical protein